MGTIEQLQRDCEYDPDGDSPVDNLIAYKDALEDLYAADSAVLDELNTLLSAPQWPGPSGLEDICVLVRKVREPVADAPRWERH